MDGVAKDKQKTIETQIGNPFKIRIWEDRDRGEAWAPIFDEEAFILLDDDYQETSTYNAGMRGLEFEALKIGDFEIVFEKRLGWKFTAENRKRFSIHVLG
ncbi:MAG TPA: protease inhibitor I42 family protein [Nitrospiria bacterium]|jgi:hypothetical protein